MKRTKGRLKGIMIIGLLLSVMMTACTKNTTVSESTTTSVSSAVEEKVTETVTEESGDKETATSEYASKLFDTSYVHTINIEISEEDWADLLENPTEKTKYHANVTIDGETVEDVSFATKGNTSLSSIASDSDSDRYSFKVNFGKYVDDQTYYGLDKLNLNNIYADNTYMKDYLSYAIFSAAGVESPLTSYVWLTVNGEDFGLYLAIEDIGESYLDRTADGEGELYKPETEMLDNVGGGPGNGDGKEFPGGDFTPPEGGDFTPPDGGNFGKDFKPGEMPDISGNMEGFGGNMPTPGEMPDISGDMPDFGDFGGFGGMGGMSNGADLAYTDDSIESYSDIFDNNETKVTEEDEQRVIAALKGLSEGTNLEEYLDTDEIIRYFVAHNFVLNYDSYTGSMLHNYYLYENDGKLSMLPWDYNLAFGGFSGGDATSLINTGIDTPLSGASEESRPMWSWIASNEEYLEKYHEIYNELLTEYFESGKFDAEIDRVYEMILPYVEKDPSAFCTAEEFKEAYENLKQFCELRAESIRKQLDGTLSATTSEQSEDAKVDASSVDLTALGSMNMGGGRDGDKGGFGGGPGKRE